MASPTEEDMIRNATEAFRAADVDGSGKLEETELIAVFKNLYAQEGIGSGYDCSRFSTAD